MDDELKKACEEILKVHGVKPQDLLAHYKREGLEPPKELVEYVANLSEPA